MVLHLEPNLMKTKACKIAAWCIMDMLLRVLGLQLSSGLLAISDSLTVSLSGSVPVKPHLDGIHGSDNLI